MFIFLTPLAYTSCFKDVQLFMLENKRKILRNKQIFFSSAAVQICIKKQWKPITGRRRFNFKLNFLRCVSQRLSVYCLLSCVLSLCRTLHLQVSLPRRLSAGGGRGAGVHASVSQLKSRSNPSINANIHICIYINNDFPTFSSKITPSLTL